MPTPVKTTPLKDLQHQRTNIKRNMSRIKDLIVSQSAVETRISSVELKCRLNILEMYFNHAMTVQSNIEIIDSNDNGRTELENIYISAKVGIEQLLEVNSSLNTSTTVVSQSIASSSSRLPRLSLPIFAGNHADYKNFITTFNQLIERENISNIEKFNHLLSCLKGSALEAVQAFPVTSENYEKALDKLKSRYDKPSLIFVETIAAIFNLPTVKQSNAQQLRSLIDNASSMFSSLSSLGSDNKISQAMLIYIIINKCDTATRTKWNESLDYSEIPTWDQCCKLLERHCQFLQSSGPISQSSQSHPNKQNRNTGQKSSFALTQSTCLLCSSPEHRLASCDEFKSMSTSQRFSTAKKHGLCLNCLGKGHQLANCPSKFRCRTCNQSHHTMLHHEVKGSQPSQQQGTVTHTLSSSPEPIIAATHAHTQPSQKNTQVILATAMVLVRDAMGSYKLGRALLDSCSQVNLITDDFAQRLHLQRDKYNVQLRGIGESQTSIKSSASTSIKSRTSNFEQHLKFCITPHITYQPDTEIDVSAWNIPTNTLLADEQFYKSRRVDLLLGAEAFFEILAVGQFKLGPNLPTIQKTLFGWVIAGKHKQLNSEQSLSCLTLNEQRINENLQRLWEIESINSVIQTRVPEHQLCEEHYIQTTRQDDNGRLIVKFPFKDDPSQLGESFDIARRRFLAIERRLLQSPEVRLQYNEFMQEYEDLGHMTRVNTPDLTQPHYYIPHHYVLKPNSETTKLRVVFDASSRTTTQTSLNDLLLVGPTIQDDLYTLLLRFRLVRYAITADIVKMYRQVHVDSDHCKYQYILWRAHPDSDLHTYQLNTVTYGTSSAPFLAIRSLHHLAAMHKDDQPIGAEVIRTSFYVDDLLSGADDLDTLRSIKEQVTEILRRGHFELAKWHSNCVDFMETSDNKELHAPENNISNALGVTWDQHNDRFLFSFTPKHINSNVTKRNILAIASSLFDPLGLLSPLIIVAKIILQELWILKVHWDESVPQGLSLAWQKCLSSLQTVSLLSVPRYCLQTNIETLQLHGFCDSSIRAYGCCIYVRSETTNGQITVQLLTSKSRVAPVKKQSLPKLELCGAHLLAKVYSKVKLQFVGKPYTVYFWSDSQIVLHWLKQHSVTLSTFVGNRVAEVQELTSDGEWKFVSTSNNPADIVSRGCTTAELNDSRWFSGPEFLLQPSSAWPRSSRKVDIDMDVVNLEKRKSMFTILEKNNYLLNRLEDISSYNRCLRVLAWMFRFIRRARKHFSFDQLILTPSELHHALNCLIWNIQQHAFANDFQLLQRSLPVKSSLKFLTPFIDASSGFPLIKVGGRLENAKMPMSQKHPLLLPSKSHFARIFVRQLHQRNHHAGPKALVALIRLQYWIVNARELARRTVRSCITCVRYKPKLETQLMGSLPTERVSGQQPFKSCGIDFCGPINIYLRIRGKGPVKAYLAVFICMTTKAVHIEVVSDLSTKAFIAALKRMISRRGLPSTIFCDNATNFVGAANQLAELQTFLSKKDTQTTIETYCANEFIEFRFIPPRAPHFGGLWEAAVKSAKGLLQRTLKNTRLTFEELYTVAAEVEAVLNSRPLSPLSSDPNDFGALTAGHFLVGDSLRALPERNLTNDNLTHLERFDLLTAVKQQFWRHWSLDYINELRARTKWTTSSPNLTEGTMVVIHEDNLPPQYWKIGRIISAVRGSDGHVRVANIRTSKGVCCRPIHKLAILPIS